MPELKDIQMLAQKIDAVAVSVGEQLFVRGANCDFALKQGRLWAEALLADREDRFAWSDALAEATLGGEK